jgi:DNA polymerase sigma
VPIVKFTDLSTGFACDVCYENRLAVYNTRLIHYYTLIDPRVHPLVFFVKAWAKRRGINEAYRGTLSSYAYVLLIVFYLQMQTPPVLPCLQRPDWLDMTDKGRTGSDKDGQQPARQTHIVDGHDVTFVKELTLLPSLGFTPLTNTSSLGDLLVGFFNFFGSQFDFNTSVVSIRTGHMMSRDTVAFSHVMVIEDPFETDHNVGKGVTEDTFGLIRSEFMSAATWLKDHPDKSDTVMSAAQRAPVATRTRPPMSSPSRQGKPVVAMTASALSGSPISMNDIDEPPCM